MKKGCKIPLIIVGTIIGAFILLAIIISIFPPSEEKKQKMAQAKIEFKQDYESLKKSFRELEEAKKELKELKEAERKKAMPKNSIKKIFGVAKKPDDSGIVRIYYTETHCSIDYRFFPLGLFLKYESELGVKLAPKIKKLYETDDQIMTLSIDVISPFQDKYGNITWGLVVSFGFTRGIFNRINWSRFLDNNLLKVAEDVTWYRTP
ncbi:unnamed protein product [marine sediment metagenome]|uniref:Uncharacterized protein n=1 Tax=marine sediment metagenome TaxID=412755 RepID=X1S1H2_9ZZZZ